MFNFTTTTFINDMARVLAQAGKELWVKSNHLVLKKDTLLKENNKVVVYKKAGCTGTPDVAKVDLSATTAGLHRLSIYVHPSMSDLDSYLSNALVFKGKPFYVEFKGGTNVVQDVIDTIKKYELLMVETPLINATKEGNSLVLTATRPSLRLTKVVLEDLVNAEDTEQEYILPGQLKVWEPVSNKVTYTMGHEDFGTYSQLTKDVVLPTWEHRRWATNQADEQPIPGALYSQYVVRMCVNRGVMGGDAVGEVTKSLTTHVFWVKEDQITAWEAALTSSFTDVDIQVQDSHEAEGDKVSARKSGTTHATVSTKDDKKLSEKLSE